MFPTIHVSIYSFDTYSLFYGCALLISSILIRNELKKHQYPKYFFIELLLVACISGFIGSKIYGSLSYWNEFRADPISFFFNINGSGWFGGFFLAWICISLFLKMKNFPILRTVDIIIPALPLAQAIGRLGCFLSGDGCYGIPTNLPWGMAFPNGLVPTEARVHPTPLYEMIIYLTAFVFLWNLRRKGTPPGYKLGLYLIIAGIGRFLVEIYRTNPRILIGLSFPQLASFFIFLIGISMIFDSKHWKLSI